MSWRERLALAATSGLVGTALGLTALTTAALLNGYDGPTAFAQANVVRAGVIAVSAVALVEVGRQGWSL